MKYKLIIGGITLALSGAFAVANFGGEPAGTAAAQVEAADKSANKDRQRAFNNSQQSEIENIVRSYLMKNPGLIREVLAELEKRETRDREMAQSRAVTDNAAELFRSSMSPVAGNANGDVTIVEFFDYNCPYCRKSFKQVVKLMEGDKKLKFVFKEFPIFGGASVVAARAALASKNQGKYFKFHKALLGEQGRVTETTVFRVAEQIGLDINQLKKDMNDSSVTAELARVQDVASKLGIRGTPAYLVGENLIPGAPQDLYDLFLARVKDVREKGCKVC